MAIVFPSGGRAKSLYQSLNLKDIAYVLTGTADPSSSATDAPQGSIYLRTGGAGGAFYVKMDAGSSTNWRKISDSVDLASKVSLSGDLMTGALGIIAGTVGAPGLYFSGDTNTGLYSPSADTVRLATGGAQRLSIDSTGLVISQGLNVQGTLLAALDFGGFKGTNAADPSSAQDLATKNYVDALITSRDWKQSVRLGTAAALPSNTYSNGSSGVGATLTGVGVGALSIDGTSVVVGDRVLVKNETTQANNGIYTVTVAGSGIAVYVLTRATDFDQSAEIENGDTVTVDQGTVNKLTNWTMTTTGTITMGTTAIVFAQTGYGTLAAGAGISLSTTGGTTTISASGTPAGNLSTKTADYTLSASDNIILVNASSVVTMTLESAATAGAGTTHVIKNIAESQVIIATTSSQTIDGDPNQYLNTQYSCITVVSDGSNWYVLSVY